MSMVTIALVLAVTAADTGSTVAAPPAVALRRYHEIERDMTEALRSEARANSGCEGGCGPQDVRRLPGTRFRLATGDE